EAGYKPPASHPDIDPPHEALQLVEQFKEMARDAEIKGAGKVFLDKATTSVRLANEFDAALRQFVHVPSRATKKAIEEAFVAVGKACTACHIQHRDSKEHSAY